MNLDFVKMVGGSHTPRHILAFIQQFPLESKTVAALRGGEQYVGWGVDRYQFAQLIDAVNSTTYAVVASNSKRKPKAPKPVPRPQKKQTGRGENNPFRKQLQAKKTKGG